MALQRTLSDVSSIEVTILSEGMYLSAPNDELSERRDLGTIRQQCFMEMVVTKSVRFEVLSEGLQAYIHTVIQNRSVNMQYPHLVITGRVMMKRDRRIPVQINLQAESVCKR